VARVRVKWTPEQLIARRIFRDAVADTIIRPAAEQILTEARRLVPVRSGRLRDSLRFKITRGIRRVRARIGSTLFYAHRTEFGFHGRDKRGRNYSQPARPFLRPALLRVLARFRI
jgi:hypothetical protein